MDTTALEKSLFETGFSNYIYDGASRFGVKVTVCEAHHAAERSLENIQISISMSDTQVEVTWQRPNGSWSCAMAHRGDALIMPSQQSHSVAWRGRAEFVNLYIEVDETSPDDSRFLIGVVRAGEMRVVRDSFLKAFSENIISLFSRGIQFNSSFMTALRLLIVEHITNNYAPDRPELAGDQRETVVHLGLLEAPLPTTPNERFSVVRPIARRQAGKERRLPSSGLAPWKLRKVLTALGCDLKQDRSVAELADLVGLSKGHFSRAFLVSTGLSPHQWIIRERLQLAMSKLAHSEDLIADIACDCGFAEQSHFTRSFTRAAGLSPAAWRRENKR